MTPTLSRVLEALKIGWEYAADAGKLLELCGHDKIVAEQKSDVDKIRQAITDLEAMESTTVVLKQRPTIAELEAILAKDNNAKIEILPNGEVRVAESGWRPIETAPRDGTLFLGIRSKIPFVTAWEDGWFSFNMEYERHHNNNWQPTYWMPIEPLPPSANTGEV